MRDYFAIGLSRQGNPQDLLLQMEAGEDFQNYAIVITCQAVTGISSVDENTVETYSLSNYPNPFNPTTTVLFNLPKGEMVNIRIYNSSGQLVRELINHSVPAGSHRVVWDGRDESGNLVDSGVFWIHLNTTTFNKTIQSVLIKEDTLS